MALSQSAPSELLEAFRAGGESCAGIGSLGDAGVD